MCDKHSFGGIGNPGPGGSAFNSWLFGPDKNSKSPKAQVGNVDPEQAALAKAAADADARAQAQWELWQRSYGPDSELGKSLASEASLDPANIETARGQATADVERNYEQALRQREENQRVMGVNPASGARQALDTRAAVDKTAARVGAGENAALNERKYRTGLGMALTGQGANLGNWATQAGGQGITALGADANAAAAEMAARAAMYKSDQENSGFGFKTPVGGMNIGGGMFSAEGGAVDEPSLATLPAAGGGMMAMDTENPMMAGHITGPGGPTEDAIDAKLSNGEYVATAFSVDEYGVPIFDTMMEVARRAQAGDPDARKQAQQIVSTIAKIGSKMPVPQRVAGQPPRTGVGMQQPAAAPGDTQVHALAGGAAAGVHAGGGAAVPAWVNPAVLGVGALAGLYTLSQWKNPVSDLENLTNISSWAAEGGEVHADAGGAVDPRYAYTQNQLWGIDPALLAGPQPGGVPAASFAGSYLAASPQVEGQASGGSGAPQDDIEQFLMSRPHASRNMVTMSKMPTLPEFHMPNLSFHMPSFGRSSAPAPVAASGDSVTRPDYHPVGPGAVSKGWDYLKEHSLGNLLT